MKLVRGKNLFGQPIYGKAIVTVQDLSNKTSNILTKDKVYEIIGIYVGELQEDYIVKTNHGIDLIDKNRLVLVERSE